MHTSALQRVVGATVLVAVGGACAPDVLLDLNAPGGASEEWTRYREFHAPPLEAVAPRRGRARQWEDRLDTGSLVGRWAHQAAVAPRSDDLRPGTRGLLIGFDDADRHAAEADPDGLLLSELGVDVRGRGSAEQGSVVDIVLGGDRRTLPTTLLEFGTGRLADIEGENDLLWSLYDEDPALAVPIDRARWALDQLLDDRIEQAFFEDRPTHVLVLATGWETTQHEAVRMHGAMLAHLTDVAGSACRPLVLTVTWPAQEVPAGAGSDRIAVDRRRIADEVGLVWLRRILYGSVLPQAAANGDVPVVLLGHGLGARALSRAAYASAHGVGPTPDERADLLVCLAGAFSARRFDPRDREHGEGAPYADPEDGPDHVVLVASARDRLATAPDRMGLRLEREAVGGAYGWDRLREIGMEGRAVYPDGRFRHALDPGTRRLAVDGSRLVGSHDDVVRREHAVMLWSMIEAWAPPPDVRRGGSGVD